ncbi:peptidylprolyl isomerase [Paenibacillus sp. R14(2021)]|uniref:peptidylprolyl isomerase n=1 Tax=Paenibacillus sp. R14(2021) TaxID=2859228 RepID=UPI001C6132C0|nr:peptidylprolyl isomerase [Paenibacillus sp. R14(2021)]
MMKNRTALMLVLSAMLIVVTACGAKTNNTAQDNQNVQSGASNAGNSGNGGNAGSTPKSWSEMPKLTIDKDKSYTAEFKTNKGDFKIELYAKDAPQTVNNFVFLANEKFYDGVKFHRIIQTFMIQGGDPTGTGGGGPGYSIPDELNNGHSYEEGTLAMANAGPNTGGSQFFICTGADAAGLNNTPNYPIFGKVSEGMDVVKTIAATPVTASPSGEPSQPTEDVIIKTITITEK